MNKSIYSLVLSDAVVDAVDALARSSGLSRSAMINRILAERVAFVTPEMRLRGILDSLARSMTDAFMLAEKPTGSTLSARTSLKYRYKPTVKYSVEIYSENGQRAGELRVSFRSQNAQLIGDLTEFFKCWAALEQKYIADKISGDILYTIQDGRFTRTLNMPRGEITGDELGATVADYMAMLDGTMKEYFLKLPEEREAVCAAEKFYQKCIAAQSVII
ncbi:MAG: ribbon-helix-helix domain-containing protein [Oscillospiraceae bacterium]|nr:ribbon-helix-helix domain-containing protein [Oscillospiraceae bacterium]